MIVETKPDSWPDQDLAKSARICALIAKIRDADRKNYPPPAGAHRKLQRYTIQIPANVHATMVAEGKIQLLCDGRFPVLTHPESDYDPKLGLLVPSHRDLTSAFVI